MKTIRFALFIAALLVNLPLAAQTYDGFTYTTTNGAVTVTGYSGLGGEVVIPSTIEGMPVTSIGNSAFANSGLTSVTIPNGVTSLGDYAFEWCTYLTSVTIPNSVTNIGKYAFAGCLSLTSVSIGNGVTSIGEYAFNQSYGNDSGKIPRLTIVVFLGKAPVGDGTVFSSSYYPPPTLYFLSGTTGWDAFATNANIPTVPYSGFSGDFAYAVNGKAASIVRYTGSNQSVNIPGTIAGYPVTDVGGFAYSSVTSVTLPSSVTNIGDWAFSDSPISTLFFQGNAPTVGTSAFGDWIYAVGGNCGCGKWWLVSSPATAYYLPGTTGWDAFATNAGIPVAVWQPQIQTPDTSFGIRTNQFGFNVTWASGMTVVVEASLSISGGTWTPLATNTLASTGTFHFTDPDWKKYPSRFYRVRRP